MLLFVGVVLTCFGSSYYHWNPNNSTLVWDRLPMTIGFMGLLSATISERVSLDFGRRLLVPLVVFGLFSVGYWHYTESTGRGDLRPYVLVQFGALLLILTMTVLYPSRYSHSRWIFATIVFYAVAKITEDLDPQIYRAIEFSGHAIKHLSAALAIAPIIYMLNRREPIHADST